MANLILRNNHYTAVLMIPQDVQHLFGKTRFSQALGTGDKRQASLLAAHYVARWKVDIEKARGKSPSGILGKVALEWQEAFKMQDQGISDARSEAVKTMMEEGMDVLNQQLSQTVAALPVKQAETIRGLVDGTKNLSAEHYDEWKNQLDLIPKTVDQMSRDVLVLIERFSTLEEITKEGVLRLVADLESEGKGPSTIKRVIGAYKNFWHYLQDKHIVDLELNPFDLQRVLRGKFKRAGKKKIDRKEFTPGEVVLLWGLAKDNEDYRLADLIALGAYTGARIEELCSLKIEDIAGDRLSIKEAKTEAGNREVPIHSAVRPLVDRLKASSEDGYLFSGLTFNKYGDRSNAIGKRFGRLKTKVGFNNTLVFHSFRKTLITMLENAGVEENFCCDIVGHEKDTIGYGHYSGGTSFINKKAAIEKVKYPFPRDALK